MAKKIVGVAVGSGWELWRGVVLELSAITYKKDNISTR